jgi:hypothetical protein
MWGVRKRRAIKKFNENKDGQGNGRTVAVHNAPKSTMGVRPGPPTASDAKNQVRS